MSNVLFGSVNNCPLTMIDDVLSEHKNVRSLVAEDLSQQIVTLSSAIAEINKLWGELMVLALPSTDPSDNGERVDLTDGGAIEAILNQLTVQIRTALDDPSADYTEITAGEETPNYAQLQQMNASMTALSDKIQVDIDTYQQEFKNEMTTITSTQEEVKEIRRTIISLSQPG
ncbi:hypothetical protein EJ063_07645 [Vibrio aquaticus]|uniref:Chemotaxis protein n=1 Tax=Vibrio aquaticus TaxID=2496559 RepID=A0A432CZK9_9VIBR|nr:hypothetical protein [Vibrio aquaticus]RTZ16658.1 hypothetical protein EJ063_07645 [Vibrio aquaticus]